ncbi:MAG: TolC family protein [Flavobacteriales bacterium]|jgi:outer membrane protein|tara:strand:- start:2006 stop:3334 length:1329 start_codon:yes stop_codon:yes gene_type:complete
MKNILKSVSTITLAFFFSIHLSAQEKWTLKDCVERAIEKNISIKNSRLDLLNVREDKKTAIGNFLPSLNYSGNHTWNTGLTQNITNGLLENKTNQFSSVNMSVGLDVFNGLANIRRLHRANLNILAKKYQLEDMKEDISLLVANSYLQILFNKEQLNIQKLQLKVSQEEFIIANEKYNNGVIPKGDLYEIEAKLAKAEQNLVVSENSYRMSKISLSQLLLFKDVEKFEIADEEYIIPESEIILKNVSEIYAVALRNRNDIKLAKTNLEIAKKDETISKSSLLPSVGSFYSFSSRVMVDAPTSFQEQYDLNSGKSFGLQINIPILNGYATRAGIKKSKINVLRNKNILEQSKLNLENTVNQSLNDARGALKAYEASKKTNLASKTSYNYAKERFENGAMNTINFLQAQQRFESSQSELIRAKYDYIFKIKVLEFYFGIPNLYL